MKVSFFLLLHKKHQRARTHAHTPTNTQKESFSSFKILKHVATMIHRNENVVLNVVVVVVVGSIDSIMPFDGVITPKSLVS